MSNQETLNQKIVFVLILFVIVIDITTLPITGRMSDMLQPIPSKLIVQKAD